ncbi:ribose-5-phosphate isomerase RpiA [Planctomycetales bacterium ZRK34]|nr:ribose-5-phosphate isomerase RpiA [Planctomycetales bacterium ZRK34]
MTEVEQQKHKAAIAAVAELRDGMIVGLGSGSTAAYAITEIGRLVKDEGLSITGIPTSRNSEKLAREVGIPLTDLDQQPHVDITIDGADRFDENRNLIKGGGGALLREKIVAAASDRLLIITDAQKQATPLGGFPVPIEVIQFGAAPIMVKLQRWELNPKLRMRADAPDKPYVTDEGNHIIDLHVDIVDLPHELARRLEALPGVVEHGLFLDMAERVYVGTDDGVTVYPPGA